MKRHYIIPIFVPHLGCPHDCVFCNQRKITGYRQAVDVRETETIIESYLATFPQEGEFHKEIAFYGGSFTGIPANDQKKLLEVAARYKQQGKVDGIRISTRPDGITMDALRFLKGYGVTVIELGVQSMDDEVLLKSRRGHSSCDVLLAVEMIRRFNFRLGLQMMIGLPGDTPAKTIRTARLIAGLQPDFARLYPAVVIAGTSLASLYRQGKYLPLSLAEAVESAAAVLLVFTKAGIPVIRIGLQPTEELCSSQGIIAGPFHPSFRELVESRIAYVMMAALIRFLPANPHRVLFLVHPRYLSAAIGNKKANIIKLSAEFGIGNIRICPDKDIDSGDVVMHAADEKPTDLRITKAEAAALLAVGAWGGKTSPSTN